MFRLLADMQAFALHLLNIAPAEVFEVLMIFHDQTLFAKHLQFWMFKRLATPQNIAR